MGPQSQCNKNTAVNYHVDFNPIFSVKIQWYITTILGSIVLYKIGYTNTMVIYFHSTVITEVILLYNTE
jgi:hypothetical protein